MDIVEYNEQLRQEYEKTRRIDVLEKYIMSETLPPIEDYHNVIKIIRNNYSHHVSVPILYVGAYYMSYWVIEEHNEMLDILNDMYPHLSNADKSIVCFLNAYDFQFKDKSYLSNPKYKEYLLESIKLNDLVVNSRIRLAELYSQSDAFEIYESAIKRIQQIHSVEEIMAMDEEDFLSVDSFINEFILGTHVSELTVETIKDKMNAL